MFITFEGIEGTGKTTQINKVRDYLESIDKKVFITLEPGGSRIGQELRKHLLSMESTDLTGETELFLYLADRAQHVSQVIKPELEKGNVVISDRFADSTVAYQGYGRGLDPKILHQFNDIAVSGCWPELTILLDIEPEDGLRRAMVRNLKENKVRAEGRFEAEELSFHTKVREGYLTWASIYRDRIKIVDASKTPDEVFEDIKMLLDSKLA